MPSIFCVSPVASNPFTESVGRGFDFRRGIIKQTQCRKIGCIKKRFPDNTSTAENFRSVQLGGRRRSAERSKGEQHYYPNVKNDKIQGVELAAHVDYISSVANPFVKHLVKLRQSSSYRHSVRSVVVVGSTPLREISECLQRKEAETVDYIFVQDGADIPMGLAGISRRIVHASPLVMQKLAGVESIEATEAIGVIKLPNSFCHMESIGMQSSFQTWCSVLQRLLVLDGIQDPGNLGTLLRTAVAFEWDGVFLLPGCCDPFNDKALRASQGACFQIPIVNGHWSHLEILRDQFEMGMYAAQQMSNRTMTRTSASSDKDKTSIIQSLPDRDVVITGRRGRNGNNPTLLNNEFSSALADKPVCLVLGSEGKGLSEQSKKLCNLVAIPMPGGFESLNVSVAGGIFLFLLRRET